MAGRRRGGAASGLFALQAQAVGLGLSWLELSLGAAEVIATRSVMLGFALTRPDRLADPEFTRMLFEKGEATGEAAHRLSRHLVRGALSTTIPDAGDLAASSVGVAQVVLSPYHRRVRANVKRLRGKRG
jgi:hypothetical protein